MIISTENHLTSMERGTLGIQRQERGEFESFIDHWLSYERP
jgi:hypothetical protein